MVADAVAKLGRMDLFVSSAVFSEREPFTTADMAGFRKTIDVSMWGAFYGLRATCARMIEQKQGGSAVIVSSPHAQIAFPLCMAYNMAKAALDSMMRTAATELLPHRIRVNCGLPRLDGHAGRAEVLHRRGAAEGRDRVAVGPAGDARRDRPGGPVPGRAGQRLHHGHRAACGRRPVPAVVVQARQRRRPVRPAACGFAAPPRQPPERWVKLISPFEPPDCTRPLLIPNPAVAWPRLTGGSVVNRNAKKQHHEQARKKHKQEAEAHARELAQQKRRPIAAWVLGIGLALVLGVIVATLVW